MVSWLCGYTYHVTNKRYKSTYYVKVPIPAGTAGLVAVARDGDLAYYFRAKIWGKYAFYLTVRMVALPCGISLAPYAVLAHAQ